MARIFERVLITAGAILLSSLAGFGQEAEEAAGAKKKRKNLANSPELENVRKAIEALSPEQRKRFQENFAKWANLSPEEKRALRERDETRRKRMGQDIERAIQQTGLDLQGTQRVEFARRYTEERRKLEEQLRRETEEKRRPGISDIVARLKTEFSGSSNPPTLGTAVETSATTAE